MIAVGVGCRKACSTADIVALVNEAIGLLPAGAMPTALFTVAEKADEPGLVSAAVHLDLPLAGLDRTVLQMVCGETRSCSPRVEEMFGLPGIAETAALAGAGSGAVLLVPRRASATVTCAIAGPPTREGA